MKDGSKEMSEPKIHPEVAAIEEDIIATPPAYPSTTRVSLCRARDCQDDC